MTIAKFAYLTSPAPGRYLLNIQPFGSDQLVVFEVSTRHLANIVIDGASFAMRENNRVPNNSNPENADGDDRRQQPA